MAMNEMINRNPIGVRAHPDGVGVKQGNVSLEPARSIHPAATLARDLETFERADVICHMSHGVVAC